MILYYKIRAFAVTWLLRILPRKTQIVFNGQGSALSMMQQLPILGFKKPIIITDSFLAGSGILDGIKNTLGECGVEFVVFDGVLPDPAFDQVQAGVLQATKEACDCVIAVGGGSVLDAAKMVALVVTNPGELKDFDGIQKAKNPGLALFAVPSTAGTGSEVTGVAVISDPVTHAKVPVVDSKMTPGFVALDAQIMKGMPPAITAATGMDALTHAVESYLSTASTAATEVQAKAAVRLIFKYLEQAYTAGDNMEARDAMGVAAFYAGAAFGATSVGYVHGIAHQFGRICHTPHGNANAMVFPEVLAAYGEVVHERLATLALEVGLGQPGDPLSKLSSAFIAEITAMRDRMEMPLKPKGLSPADVPDIVDAAIKEAGELYPVMRYMSREEITAIVTSKLGEAA
jgi:alcohol dehydrogenase class IV